MLPGDIPSFSSSSNVGEVISQMTLDEKVTLLSGATFFEVNGLERLGIPRLRTADGPHGIRAERSFESNPSCLLPCGTAMGATFDTELIERVGNMLAEEARNKRVHCLLAPVVCMQRSPLIGRGFEAFGEDPVLSGIIGAAYIRGLQDRGVAACLKHYAAHDQSKKGIEDNVCMTERTLRELHLLPFQLALKLSNPWAFMTAYQKINGIHASEDPMLLKQVLREDWGYDGLTMSDWWGTYSTSEAINNGLDLEMPGPSVYRGRALSWAVESRKVKEATVNQSVRNLLKLLQKVLPNEIPSPTDPGAANRAENRALIRSLAANGIVLLKNSTGILPLKNNGKKTFGLIGDHFTNPALGGGGSSEVEPYYTVIPYDAFVEAVGADRVSYCPGAYSFKFSPYLKGLAVPNSYERGWLIEIHKENPESRADSVPLITTTCPLDLIDIPERTASTLPAQYFVRARSTWTPTTTGGFRIGLAVTGKGKLRIDGRESIDLWTDHPPKTDETPIFNRVSMERFSDLNAIAGKAVELELLLTNAKFGRAVGTAATLTARIGGFEIIDEEKAIQDAVELAKQVDHPIVMAGLSMDYEFEGSDRKTLRLPRRTDELIEAVLQANPGCIIVTQSGLPIEMPWIEKASTVLHAWFGGQETGHSLVDVVFGDVNPAGRLSTTFPKTLQQTPAFLTFGKVDHVIMYGEGVFIGYRYYEKLEQEPLFYFGHGLSYSKFEYSNLTVPSVVKASPESRIEISVDVTNSGPYKGAEVVQIYIQDLTSSVQRPSRELKGFQKPTIEVGETVRVKVTLDKYALSFWSEEDYQWKAEKGTFAVIIARSANPMDEILRSEFELERSFWWRGL